MCLLSCALLAWVPVSFAHFPSSLWELGGGYWKETGEAEGKIHIKPLPQMILLDIDKALVELEGHLKHKSFPRLQDRGKPRLRTHKTKPHKRATSPAHPVKAAGCSSYACPTVNLQKIKALGL